MPFTLSHAVLAPPLSKLSRGHLPIAALAIGCMTPDLYRLFTTETIALTHQWSGILFPNLPIGLCFCLLWYLLYRPVIYRFLGIRHPLKIKSFDETVAFILMCCLAIILGTATHLIWDGLTHLDFRSFAFQDFLAQSVQWGAQTYPMHRILQIGSSILALPFLLWMSLHYYRKHRQVNSVSTKIRVYAIGLIILSIVCGGFSLWDYARYIPDATWQAELYYFTGRAINEFSQGTLLMFSLGCLLFLFLDRQG